MNYRTNVSFLSFKLILALGLVLNAGAGSPAWANILAQPVVEPFPGRPVRDGLWDDVSPDDQLIYLGSNRLLGWNPTSGRYHIWRFDPAFTGTGGAFPDQRLAEGTLPAAGAGHTLTFLGGRALLNWETDTGQYRVQQYGLDTSNRAARLTLETQVEGTLPETKGERRLIYLGNNRVLDWEPAGGHYRIWHYDPAARGSLRQFPGELVVAGQWPAIRTGHELLYLGYRRLLDWEPAGGHYRIWRYDPMITGSGNPLVGPPVAEGVWDTLDGGHQLLSLGSNHLLDWQPATGRVRVWQFELQAIGAFPIDDIGAKLANQTISGVTVVTHGRQLNDGDGDSLIDLATAIHNKAGGWLIDYDVDGNGNDFFDSCTNDCNNPAPGAKGTHEVVLLYDWAAESNEASSGWGEAAADALFSLLIKINLLDPTAANNPPYHFIAHSFGTAVTGDLVERMATFNRPVDQVTFLDPHDFDEGFGFDGAQRLFELGQPAGYGATIWHNVTFADGYYQTRGQGGTILSVPNGRPIPGAYNRFLLAELPDPSGYPLSDVAGDHGYVWYCFYRATVMGSNPAGCLPPVAAPNFSQTGYAFSRIEQAAARPAPNFYTGQDHTFSNPQLVDVVSGLPNLPGLAGLGLTAGQVSQGRWPPDWRPSEVANGDFEHHNTLSYNPGPVICINVGLENTCPQPGWTDHGGGGEGHFDQANNNAYLVLDWGNTFQTHNRFYIPTNATALLFDLRRQDGPSGSPDLFEVQLGPQTLATYTLTEADEDADFVTRTLPLPGSLLGQVVTLTARFSTPIELFDGSTVWVDNIRLQAPATGGSGPVYLPVILR